MTHLLFSTLFLFPASSRASNEISAAVKLCALGATVATGAAAYWWHSKPSSFTARFFALERTKNRTKIQEFFAQYSTQMLEEARLDIDNPSIPLILWLFMRARSPHTHDFDFHMEMLDHLILKRRCDINKPFPGLFKTNLNGPESISDPTLLHIVCTNPSHNSTHSIKLLKLLINAHANVNALNSHAYTPLALCCAGNLFGHARILIEAGAIVNRHGSCYSPLEIARRDCRRYENGLTTLLILAGAQDISAEDHDPQTVILPTHLKHLFEASYPDLVRIVEQQNNHTHAYGPKRNALSIGQYATIMERRVANLTDPTEHLACAVRLRCLLSLSLRGIQSVDHIAKELDTYLQPKDVVDIILHYALIPGPMMEKKPKDPALLFTLSDNNEQDDHSDPDISDALASNATRENR